MKKSQDNRIDSIIAAMFIACFIWFCLWCCSKPAQGQNVQLIGKTFVEQKTDTVSRPQAKKTDYVFIDNKGDGGVYPIWISSKGKCFIIKVSKKTGNEYRKYLPEVTKILTEK